MIVGARALRQSFIWNFQKTKTLCDWKRVSQVKEVVGEVGQMKEGLIDHCEDSAFILGKMRIHLRVLGRTVIWFTEICLTTMLRIDSKQAGAETRSPVKKLLQ